MNVCVYIYIYIYIYIRTCTHTYIHMYMRTYSVRCTHRHRNEEQKCFFACLFIQTCTRTGTNPKRDSYVYIHVYTAQAKIQNGQRSAYGSARQKLGRNLFFLMFAHTYIFAHTKVAHTLIHIQAQVQNGQRKAYVCIYIYTHTYKCRNTYIHTYTYRHKSKLAHSMLMYVYLYTHI